MSAAAERKLTTLLSADVAGYSRLMEADEPGTLVALKACREAFAEEIAVHRGRLVNTAGDALLAEFASVVNAVECAVKVQRLFVERNAARPPGRRMFFRIGINLGDVLVENGDLFGEGVNVAARLQALAEPGGILISGTVFDQVRSKLTLGFDYLGPQAVKNISDPIPAWRIKLGEGASDLFARRQKVAAERPDEGQPAAAGEAPKPVSAAAPHRSASPRPFPSGKGRLWHRMKRSVAIGAVLIAFLFAINMLTYHGVLWFKWPTLAILLVLGLRAAFALGR
jgi:class 3 adenylate cyclase